MEEFLALMYEAGVQSSELPSWQPGAILSDARSRVRVRRAVARRHAREVAGGRRKIGYEPPGFDPADEAGFED